MLSTLGRDQFLLVKFKWQQAVPNAANSIHLSSEITFAQIPWIHFSLAFFWPVEPMDGSGIAGIRSMTRPNHHPLGMDHLTPRGWLSKRESSGNQPLDYP